MNSWVDFAAIKQNVGLAVVLRLIQCPSAPQRSQSAALGFALRGVDSTHPFWPPAAWNQARPKSSESASTAGRDCWPGGW
jgi:hypothetical protein